MAEFKLFLVCRNVDREGVLRKGLAGDGRSVNVAGIYRTAESAGDFGALIVAARPDALFVDSSVSPDEALKLATTARERFGRVVSLIAVAEKDFDFLQRAMEAGIDSVMPEPVDMGEVFRRAGSLVEETKRKALEAHDGGSGGGRGIGTALTDRMKAVPPGMEVDLPAASAIDEGAKKGVMLAFLSGKDGEGKSTVALNLGLSLAKKYGKKVLYLDLGETLSETAMLLNRKPPGNLMNMLAVENKEFTPYGVQRFAIDYFDDQSFLAICGNPTIVPPKVDRDALDLLLRFVKTQAEFILLDCPVRFGDILKTALKLSDWHVVVVQNTLSSLRNTRVFLGELKRLEYPAHQVRIALNRVSRNAGLAKEDIAKNIDPYPVVTTIVSNGPVAIEAVTVGLPLVLHAPDSDIAQSIHSFAGNLLGIETSDQADMQGFSIGSMISSFLGG